MLKSTKVVTMSSQRLIVFEIFVAGKEVGIPPNPSRRLEYEGRKFPRKYDEKCYLVPSGQEIRFFVVIRTFS